MTCKIPCKLRSAFSRHFRGIDVMRRRSSRDEGSKNQSSITKSEPRLDWSWEIWDWNWNWNIEIEIVFVARGPWLPPPKAGYAFRLVCCSACRAQSMVHPRPFDSRINLRENASWNSQMVVDIIHNIQWLHDMAKSSKLRIVSAGS